MPSYVCTWDIMCAAWSCNSRLPMLDSAMCAWSWCWCSSWQSGCTEIFNAPVALSVPNIMNIKERRLVVLLRVPLDWTHPPSNVWPRSRKRDDYEFFNHYSNLNHHDCVCRLFPAYIICRCGGVIIIIIIGKVEQAFIAESHLRILINN